MSESQKREMASACYYGFFEEVNRLLNESPSLLNAQVEGDFTPLHRASWNGGVNVVNTLLARKADVDCKTNNGRTPLYHACYNGHVEIVKKLLKANANLDFKKNDKNKPGRDFCSNVDAATQQIIIRLLNEERERRIQQQQQVTTPLSLSSSSLSQQSPSSASSSSSQALTPLSPPMSSPISQPSPSSASLSLQPLEIGWETSTITPPARCFKRSPQLNFEEAIRHLLLGFEEVPPRRPDLFLADEDDVHSLISCCQHTLSEMATYGSDEVREVVRLLTHDEALVILAYTCEDPYPVYRWLNAWLVQDRRDPVVKSCVGPFFRLLYQGLEKLPKKTVEAGRGVLVHDIEVLQNCFNSPPSVGATISFWGVSSFSLEDNVASGFGGGAGEKAIFYVCGRLQCVLLGKFSMTPTEAEVLPLPPAVFKVQSTFRVSEQKLVISLDHDQAAHANFAYVPPQK